MRTGILIVLGIIIGAPALSFAWTAPTASPPGANVASPINVSSTAQLKNGTLGVNALGVFGNTILNGTNGDGTGNGVNSYLNFGATAGQSGYGIRDNNGTLEFKSNSGSWGSLNVTLTNLMQVNGITSNGLGQITSIKFGDGTTQTTAASANPWSTNGTSIYYNGGNVGIGTASPQINLDIQSSTSVGLNLVAPQNANSFLHLYQANGTGAGWAIGRTLNTDNLVFNWDDSPGHVQYTFFSMTPSGVINTNYFQIAGNQLNALSTDPYGEMAFNYGGLLNANFTFFNGNGQAVARINGLTGAYSQLSDARLKTNIQTFPNAPQVVQQLRGVTFNWKKDGAPSAGVIAQEVEKVMPSAVKTNPDGMKTVDYSQFVAPMIEAIKEQQTQLDAQKKETDTQKLCISKSDGTNVCVTGDQLAALLANQATHKTQ